MQTQSDFSQIEIIPLAISNRNILIKEINDLYQNHKILCIVGTFNPELYGIPFISINKLFDTPRDQLSLEEDFDVLKKGKSDFLSFSYYCPFVTTADKEIPNDAMGNLAMGPKNPYLPYSEWEWSMDPKGLRCFINEIYGRYNVPIMVVENGLGSIDKIDKDGLIHDKYRIDYLNEHIKCISEAIDDGSDVIAYTAWGCIDLVSGSTGEMSKRYGFIYVDKDDFGRGTYNRLKKDSFSRYKKVISNNGIDF